MTRGRLFIYLLLTLGLLVAAPAWAQEVIPPAPKTYLYDQARLITGPAADQLEQKLRQFERDTSIQFIVAIFAKMQSDSDVADYAQRVAEKWGVGQKKTSNGVVLFVFVQDRQVYITTGYGVEGALPDALAKRIIDEQIVPKFRAGDYAGGVIAGVDSVMAATRGEYKGTGRVQGDGQSSGGQTTGQVVSYLPGVIFLVLAVVLSRARGYGYRRRGYGWSGGFGGGGFRGGGGFGGGGFSGGGGSFGGGGAGGRW